MKSVWARLLVIVAMIGISVTSFGADADDEVIKSEKEVTAKKNELKGLRLRNAAHIWGEDKQSTATRKRMPKAGEKKYYTSQIVDVRPWCVCKHAPLKNGGTKARHPKNWGAASLGQESRDVSCTPAEICPQWKEWDAACKKVAETETMNKEIDTVAAELEKLEKDYKEKLEANAEARKKAREEAKARKNAKEESKARKTAKEDTKKVKTKK